MLWNYLSKHVEYEVGLTNEHLKKPTAAPKL